MKAKQIKNFEMTRLRETMLEEKKALLARTESGADKCPRKEHGKGI